MSFAWMFAIIVGAFILFIAIYASSKVIDTGRESKAVQAGKEIGILLNPLETGFESGKTNSITMPVDTRIHNLCSDFGNFGKQGLKVSQKSFGDWSETDMQTDFPNKYIFSEDIVEGKEFYLFSKPLKFPYKLADLIYMSSEKRDYCFVEAPESIKRELQLLDQENIDTNCSENKLQNSIKVCFNRGNCDIRVDYNGEKVFKKGEVLEFREDALMYAAVFGEPEIYECQLKRLVKRMKNLAELYKEKAVITSTKGCDYNINLDELISVANNYESSANLRALNNIVEEINKENSFAQCKLW